MLSVRFWPILLKKSAMVSTAEKYAFEIEIFTLSRGFRAQISRSRAQERHLQQSVHAQPGRIDFFNTIGRSLPIMVSTHTGQIRRNRGSGRTQTGGQVACNFAPEHLHLRRRPEGSYPPIYRSSHCKQCLKGERRSSHLNGEPQTDGFKKQRMNPARVTRHLHRRAPHNL